MEDSNLKLEVLHQLRRCGHFLHHMMGDGKASQSRVLHILYDHENITQSQLQEIMGIRQSSMSELVQKLEEQHLISRERSEDDRRQILVFLTDAGREELHTNDEKRSAQARELLVGLSGEEQEQLSCLLGKLLSDWEVKRNPECRHSHSRARDQEGSV
ncbi:MAG: MarR family winged helix-turn-helix transcriptional regulator [Faecousia sp.]